jgi:flagellar secretion chaperone FliS
MNQQGALKHYNQVRAHAQTEGASPHRLIQILMDGALEKIRAARGLIERRDIPEKVRNINWALSLIDGLRHSLDLEKGGEIAGNLEDLYDYMQRRLIVANAENNPSILDEVAGLMLEIKSAWDAIPEIISRESPEQAGGQIYNVVTPSL